MGEETECLWPEFDTTTGEFVTGVNAAAKAIEALQKAIEHSFPYYGDEYATCFSEGDSGNCGINCRVFLRGDCEQGQEIIAEEIKGNDIDSLVNMAEDEITFLRKAYPHSDLDLL